MRRLLTVAALLPGLVGCGDSALNDVRKEFEDAAGARLWDCGGPRLSDPDRVLDGPCELEAIEAGKASEIWQVKGAGADGDMFQAEFRFVSGGSTISWSVLDARGEESVGGLWLSPCDGSAMCEIECRDECDASNDFTPGF